MEVGASSAEGEAPNEERTEGTDAMQPAQPGSRALRVAAPRDASPAGAANGGVKASDGGQTGRPALAVTGQRP